ncbi:hypothetical protein ACS0TY_033214 [Phlomoides rotata]
MGNYLFKNFTKIVASRLGSIAARILTPFQFGFIPRKCIHTCIALASNTINIMDTPTKRGNIALKINIHKAFDTISWCFLMSLLQKLRFSDIFYNLVSAILHLARLSILINSSPNGYFEFFRGIKQGDLLSPLLFCITEKALGRWIDWETISGRITQMLRAPRYLFYVNDILIFAKAATQNIRYL